MNELIVKSDYTNPGLTIIILEISTLLPNYKKVTIVKRVTALFSATRYLPSLE